MSEAEHDAVVVGGGIVGTAVGYHLARDGVETLLVDRADEGRATDAGAGILSPPTSSREGSEKWFRFAVAANRYYPDLIDRLAADGETETSYERCGILRVAVGADASGEFDAALARIRERQDRLGYPEPGSLEELGTEAARERFPPLADVSRALYYDDAARVDGKRITNAMRRAGETHGLTVRRGDVEEVVLEDGAVAGVVADGERYDARAVVVAGGAWSGAFGDQLGVDIPVEPRRGQIVHLDLGGVASGDWPVVSAVDAQYVVPWPGGRAAVGATREDAGFAPHTTVEGVRSVLDAALETAPGFADAEMREIRVGLRPEATDGLPVVGEVPGVENAYVATGHGATGLQLGPFTGKAVADLFAGRDPGIDLGPFAPERFG